VEYAMEAINKAGAAVGILTNAGLVLVSERQDVSALLEKSNYSNRRPGEREDLLGRPTCVLPRQWHDRGCELFD